MSSTKGLSRYKADRSSQSLPRRRRAACACLIALLAILLVGQAGLAKPEVSLRTLIMLEFGRLLPPRLEAQAVNLARDVYALGFREESAGPYVVRAVSDCLYDAVHQLHLDLYLPEPAREPVPVVLLIHGGGWKYFSKAVVGDYGRLLASHGFAAMAVDYRLAPHNKWPAQLEDLRMALAWLNNHALEYGLDPTRVAALGDSAGGHLAAMLALSSSESSNPPGLRLAAAVSFYGVYDLVPLLTTGEEARINPVNQLLPAAADIEQVARAASPIAHVSGNSPPFLLIHGLEDCVVPVDQTRNFAARLERYGVAVETVYVAEADHLLLSVIDPPDPPLTAVDRTVLEFLRRHLQQPHDGPA